MINLKRGEREREARCLDWRRTSSVIGLKAGKSHNGSRAYRIHYTLLGIGSNKSESDVGNKRVLIGVESCPVPLALSHFY